MIVYLNTGLLETHCLGVISLPSVNHMVSSGHLGVDRNVRADLNPAILLIGGLREVTS